MPPYVVLAIQMHFSHQYHQCLPYVTVNHSQVLLHFQAVMSVLDPIARKVFMGYLFPAFSALCTGYRADKIADAAPALVVRETKRSSKCLNIILY